MRVLQKFFQNYVCLSLLLLLERTKVASWNCYVWQKVQRCFSAAPARIRESFLFCVHTRFSLFFLFLANWIIAQTSLDCDKFLFGPVHIDISLGSGPNRVQEVVWARRISRQATMSEFIRLIVNRSSNFSCPKVNICPPIYQTANHG